MIPRAWPDVGVRRRVVLVFAGSALLLAVSTGLIIWTVSRGYLVDARQNASLRQASGGSGHPHDRVSTGQQPP